MGLASSAISCSDFLDQVNPNAITTDTFWADLNDCEQGLTAVYNAFRDTEIFNPSVDNNRADMTYPGYGRPSTTNEFWLQTFTDASGPVNSRWKALYEGIFRANQVIKGLNGIEDNMKTEDEKEMWRLQMGQARLFRGLFHFWLHETYNKGSVIIYDFVPADESEFMQPLSSSEDVLAFFREDFLYAEANLCAEWEDKADTGRVTSGTASSLLGMTYLYEKEFDLAAEEFKKVIDSGVYDLADISENSTTKGEFNCESILEASYTINFNTEWGAWDYRALHNQFNCQTSTVGGWRTIIPSAWLTMAFKEEVVDPMDSRNIRYDYEGNNVGFHKYSLRTSYSIALPDDVDLEFYGKEVPGIAAMFNNKEYAYFRKHSNWDICENENDLEQRSGINYRVIRLADVYLMYAEALIQGGNGGDVDAAMMYVNRVRRRAGVRLIGTGNEAGAEYVGAATYDGIAMDATALMDHLMYIERPLELCLEGYSTRQIDLRRWGITKQRFEELAQTRFTNEDPKNEKGENIGYSVLLSDGKTLYLDDTGNKVTRWGSILKRFNEGEHAAADAIVDFQQAAINFNVDQHAYFPIPNGESMANPNLYK